MTTALISEGLSLLCWFYVIVRTLTSSGYIVRLCHYRRRARARYVQDLVISLSLDLALSPGVMIGLMIGLKESFAGCWVPGTALVL